MKKQNVVSLTSENKAFKHPSLKQFTQWINVVLKKLSAKKNYEINIHLASKENSQKLNYQYRGKNYATNVLSFSYPAPQKNLPIMAELVFCPKVIIEEAKTEKKSLKPHWAHLTVHGMLHILGFDHETDNEAEKMQVIEIKILTQLGYPDPYK